MPQISKPAPSDQSTLAVIAAPERPARILVTDDRPQMLMAIEQALGAVYECEFASSLTGARAQLAAGQFDLALCDIQVGGEAALAFAEEIIREHAGTAVVLITGEEDPSLAKQAFAFGAYGYLVEPLRPGELLIATMNALRRRQLETAASAHSRDELSAAQLEAIDELRLSRRETVERLAKAIEMHDASTGEHVNRIGAIAAFLGTRLRLDPARVELLRSAALMHDVGKIGTPDEILRKPGPLTAAERTEMERHTLIGHEILCESQSELLRVAASIALTHHERFDGCGYPHGLAGEEIPLEGRITAVADVFDALLSDRCYRAPMSVGEAVELIRAGRGTQFDPAVTDALLDHLDEALTLRG